MKDSYSFDVDDAGLDRSYAAHREAYIKIFDRLGLDYVIVSAMSGAMGGSRSEEFLHPTPIGEDTFVRSAGGYAANVEAVRTVVPDSIPFDGLPEAHVENTPDTPTIETLVQVARELFPDQDYGAASTLKNVVVTLVHPDGKREPLIIGLPGDRDVDTKRLEAQVAPAEVEPFTAFDKHPALVKGYIGPQALGAESDSKIRYLVDPRVVPGSRWITGANEPGRHVFDLVAGRDFTWDGVIEAAEVLPGDPAPDGSGPVELARGVEMGHIFQLGRKYAEALDLKVLDENGKLVTVTMGSYGVGVSRAVAAIAESTHDELGLVWPREIAPADVHVVATGKDPAIFEAAESLGAELVAAGLTVLYDDRPKVSPGVKFKDAELLGMPTIVTVGRGLAEGVVELRDRASDDREDVPVGAAAARILAAVRG
jgi:prolyl-tRNA synthetase